MNLCLDRFTMQTIVTKLDTNAMTLAEAKAFFQKQGVTIEGRTKSIFIKNLAAAVAANK